MVGHIFNREQRDSDWHIQVTSVHDKRRQKFILVSPDWVPPTGAMVMVGGNFGLIGVWLAGDPQEVLDSRFYRLEGHNRLFELPKEASDE